MFSQDIIGENLYLNNLIEFIQDNYTTTDVLSYNGARDVLYGYIDNNNGSVSCVYTNYTVNNVPANDPRPIVYSGGIDCEHVWPQSLYLGTSPMKSDLHHLRPAKSNVNSSRGNKPYNEIADLLSSWTSSQIDPILYDLACISNCVSINPASPSFL